MTITDSNTKTFEQVLQAAVQLVPTLFERAPRIEAARRIPSDVLDDVVAAGCYRVLLPTTHGGVEADLPSAMRVFETLARGDASVAWTTMIGGGAWCDLASLPRSTFDELYAAGPDAIVAGAFNPTGRALTVDDGYRVDGRWSFASGCQHADWLYGNCIEAVVDNVPHLRIAVLRPDQVLIEDTWHVSGLCGTGSHHIRVDDVVVPRDWTFVPLVDEPCVDTAVVRLPPPTIFSLGVASVALGIAQGALDDITALAPHKTPLLAHEALADNPQFQFELAMVDTDLRAARALLYETAQEVWASAVDAIPLDLRQRARVRAAALWATERASEVVVRAHRSGGGGSIYADCPLQRRLRDVQALSQHFLVRRDTMTTAGAILAGRDVQVMVF